MYTLHMEIPLYIYIYKHRWNTHIYIYLHGFHDVKNTHIAGCLWISSEAEATCCKGRKSKGDCSVGQERSSAGRRGDGHRLEICQECGQNDIPSK